MDKRSKGSMLIKHVFLTIFFSSYLILNLLVGSFMVDFYNPLALLSLFIIELINILVSYRLSEFITSLVAPDADPPRLDVLRREPSVALLYLTFNDAIPVALDRLKAQTYRNHKVFVLDDSDDINYRDIVDSYNYTVIRRQKRDGFKAGAINNWLSIYGDRFDYFILLDSDSIVNDDFIFSMVTYAEHPENHNVAIFQSKWRIWNTTNRFPRLMASLHPLWFYSFERLANHYDTPLIMGHNNLFRTAHIMSNNGFDDRFVCEDLAVSLDLLERGYQVRYVNVVSYEACPETVQSYANRFIRWAMGTVEVAKKGSRNISFISNFHLFITTFSYLVYLTFLPGMFIVTWGYTSSFKDLIIVLDLILSGAVIRTPLLAPLTLIGVYAVIFLLLKFPLALRLGVPVKDYFMGLLVVPAIDFFMMVPLIIGICRTLLGKKVVFLVTDKKSRRVTLLGVFRQMSIGVILWAFLVIGVMRNPVSIIFNFFWMIPFITAPFVLYAIQQDRVWNRKYSAQLLGGLPDIRGKA